MTGNDSNETSSNPNVPTFTARGRFVFCDGARHTTCADEAGALRMRDHLTGVIAEITKVAA